MALKTFNPVTPSLRGTVLVSRADLHKGKPVKELTEGMHSTGGRNNRGVITSRFMGGGHKRRYRLVDFKRKKRDMVATVERLEYDPYRTAFIALIKYEDGELSYIIAPQRLKAGDKVIAECVATVGAVSNPDNQNINFGKAGRMRWLGFKPHNRGVSMNPVDHPLGGGEGKTSGGRHPVTPWGKPTKGKRTRNNKKTQNLIMRSRHLAKKS